MVRPTPCWELTRDARAREDGSAASSQGRWKQSTGDNHQVSQHRLRPISLRQTTAWPRPLTELPWIWRSENEAVLPMSMNLWTLWTSQPLLTSLFHFFRLPSSLKFTYQITLESLLSLSGGRYLKLTRWVSLGPGFLLLFLSNLSLCLHPSSGDFSA